eukprot:c21152_g1_i1.p1 GENE.c21152_g1_i1~~c21152_g1_i1.p1  ORF type:complete len:473 (+),score=189.33 c21152_g1_i1:131-1420(+)
MTITHLQRAFDYQSISDQIDKIGNHPPRFTYFITIIQIIIFMCSMITGEIAKWGFSSERYLNTVPTFSNHNITIAFTIADNMWYGPDTATILNYGAKYVPCMRELPKIVNKKKYQQETEKSFGCCISPEGDCGMMSINDCHSYSSNWTTNGTLCSSLIENGQCSRIVLRPCCYGVIGTCSIVSEQYCSALPNPKTYHKDSELCSDVNCFNGICGMGTLGNINGETPNQWWRFVTPIFMHVGIGHLFLNTICQLKLGAAIEQISGFWKMAIMYLMSGIGGNIIASVVDSTSFSCGSSSAIYGLIGVDIVDLLQTWQLETDHKKIILSLIPQLILILGIGTLPWFDNFAHLGGFFIGIISGYAFLPYLHFGDRDRIAKILVSRSARIGTFVLFLVLFILFYIVNDPSTLCTQCKYLNCIPWTEGFCDSVWT